MEFKHIPVLFNETIESLDIKPEGIYVDGTAGGGGHSEAILKHLTTGKLVSIDQDPDAIRTVTERLSKYPGSIIAKGNFASMRELCAEKGITEVDGVLLDIGVSSYQLDTPERGFSYMADAPLDMRMDKRGALSAYDVVNGYDEDRLKKILYEYGEERFSASIVAAIIRERQKKPIETTLELSDIIKYAIPPKAREGGHHPAKRSFQAIRIEVNGELAVIEPAIRDAASLLRRGGRIAIITFHSLEDRIVKQTFASLATGCTCPKSFPVCVCGNKPTLKVITRKPILPSDTELEENPRSRSAKLRVAEKL